jgi:ppGpp synthetase/RelA/SpoT-type nucleotidyltranferase
MSDSDDDSMDWATPQYKRAEVDRAGRGLANPTMTPDNPDQILMVVDNWRSSHSYPLHALTQNLRVRANAIDQDALIAQRLKRLNAIVFKLQRQPKMRLSQMQDIGGCRAVVKDCLSVDALVSRFERTKTKCWELQGKDDYIIKPKLDSYRSIHLVYRYCNPSTERSVYNKLRIELQIRSHLQHAWATALETVDTFTRQALKADKGNPDWQRFFALMGASMALREGRSSVPNTPAIKTELFDEIAHLAKRLKVIRTLAVWTDAIKITQESRKPGNLFLLTLDLRKKTMQTRTFPSHLTREASEVYSQLEKQNMGNIDIQSVLVSVNSLDALRAAYPNYYMDTTDFLKIVREDIDPQMRLLHRSKRALSELFR